MACWERGRLGNGWHGAPFQGLVFLCYGLPGAMPQAGMELRRWRVGMERGADDEGRRGEGSEK